MAKYNPFDEFIKVMDSAARVMGINEEDYVTFKYPEREIKGVPTPYTPKFNPKIPHTDIIKVSVRWKKHAFARSR